MNHWLWNHRRKTCNKCTAIPARIFQKSCEQYAYKWGSSCFQLSVKSTLVLLCFALFFFICVLWLVKRKTCATFSTNQDENKNQLQLACTHFPVFYVLTLSCDWFIWLFATVVIGYSNCFGFCFTSLSWKRSKCITGTCFSKVLMTYQARRVSF